MSEKVMDKVIQQQLDYFNSKTPVLPLLDPQSTNKQATHRYIRPTLSNLKGGRITISPGLTWMLKLHARRWRPAESCAMLIGYKDDKSKKFDIRGAMLCSNPTHSPGYFEIPPTEIIKCFEFADKHKMEIVGVFHSHPNGFETPSVTDEGFMEFTPGAWIIYSWTGYRCYTLKQSRFKFWNVKELKIIEQRTDEKPIIEYAYNWKTMKFPPKFIPWQYRSKASFNQSIQTIIPISQIRSDPDRVNWPPYWEDMYGKDTHMY